MAKAGKKHDRLIFNGEGFTDNLFAEREETVATCEVPAAFDPTRPEESYTQAVPLEHRRRYGQFFTPEPIADLMCQWILEHRPRRILDPATGTGIFIREILKRASCQPITAIDVDPMVLEAAKMATKGEGDNVEFLRADFLTWPSPSSFDAIIANPPYLKHHNFHYDCDIFREIGRRCKVRLSRLTNIYVLFILEICRRLNDGGASLSYRSGGMG